MRPVHRRTSRSPRRPRSLRLARGRGVALAAAAAALLALTACSSSASTPTAVGTTSSSAAASAATSSASSDQASASPSDSTGTPTAATGADHSATAAPATVAGSAARPATATRTTSAHRTLPPVTVPDTANGTTVSLAVGQTLHVVLGAPDRTGSTYWQFATPAGASVHSSGGVSTLPGPRVGRCAMAGSGCGTVTLTVVASRKGNATISASRTTCGEAMRCSPAQGAFRLQVHVS